MDTYKAVMGTRNQRRGWVQAYPSQQLVLPALPLSFSWTCLRTDLEIAQRNLSYTQQWDSPQSCAGTKPPVLGCEMDGLQPVPSVDGLSGRHVPPVPQVKGIPGGSLRVPPQLPHPPPAAADEPFLCHVGASPKEWSRGSSLPPAQEGTPRDT